MNVLTWLQTVLKRLSLFQRFMIVGFITLVVGMYSIGWWIGERIADGVVHQTAATAALYVDSFIAPQVQELGQAATLSSESLASLSALLRDTVFGQNIVAFKIWSTEGQVLHNSIDPSSVGTRFAIDAPLAQALRGEVAGEISNLAAAENVAERKIASELLEVYAPIRLRGSSKIIAVAEFYQQTHSLITEIAASKLQSWRMVGAIALAMYALLLAFVRTASNVIERQKTALSNQVISLGALLNRNNELSRRVQAAAASASTNNERLLRRVSAELHDGPVQNLGFALLQLDRAIAAYESYPAITDSSVSDGGKYNWGADLGRIQLSIQQAMQEMRTVAAGLGLPQLNELTLSKSLSHVIRAHARRTGSKVA